MSDGSVKIQNASIKKMLNDVRVLGPVYTTTVSGQKTFYCLSGIFLKRWHHIPLCAFRCHSNCHAPTALLNLFSLLQKNVCLLHHRCIQRRRIRPMCQTISPPLHRKDIKTRQSFSLRCCAKLHFFQKGKGNTFVFLGETLSMHVMQRRRVLRGRTETA